MEPNLAKDVTLTSAGGEVDFTGNIVKNGTSKANVTINGTGANPLVKLAGTNTYTGATIVASGKLLLSGAAALPAASVLNVGSGATLSLADGAVRTTTGRGTDFKRRRPHIRMDHYAGRRFA